MTALLAQATYRVLDAGHELRSALAEGLDIGPAADRLAAAVETSMITFDEAVQGFEPSSPAGTRTPETVEDLLATALGQFWVADVAVSAGTAVGEDVDTGAPSPDGVEALDAALAGVGTTAAALDTHPGELRIDFATGSDVSPPADLPAAVALLRERTTTTLGVVADTTTEVFTQAVTALRDYAPEAVRNAWKQFEERFNLGGFGGRLLRLGLRALEAALAALHRLVPASAVLAARDHIRMLGEALGSGTPTAAVARWALAIDVTAAAIETDLARDGLQIGRLTLAAATLDELAARCGRVMQLAGGASVAIVAIGTVAGLVQLAIPNLPIILAAAQLLVLATALVLGRDFVDTGSRSGWVRGVRVIVRAAVEPA